MPTARSGQIDVYYEVHGVLVRAEPAVLIMGLGADHTAWGGLVPALARHRRVLVLDNRGCGRSARPPGPYSTAEMAADVVAALDDAGIARAHVVGLSLGGMIAQEMALGHARRVRSLVLVATAARADAALAEAAAQSVPAGPEEDRQGLRGQVEALLAHDTVARLSTIGAPTLVVLATADPLVAPALSRALARGIPRSLLREIPAGSHALQRERPGELAALLEEWLAGLWWQRRREPVGDG